MTNLQNKKHSQNNFIAPPHVGAFKDYSVKSPSGLNFKVQAETLYHAIAIVCGNEGGKYSNSDYLKLS